MTKSIQNPAGFTPGKWGSIPSLHLPDHYLKTDARLATLDNNVVAKLYVFRSGCKLAKEPTETVFPFRRFNRAFVTWMLATLKALLQFSAYLLVGAIMMGGGYLMRQAWIIFLIPFAIMGLIIARNAFVPTRDFFNILRRHMADLRPLPITGLDYALAHWGVRLLHDPVARQFPAIALWTACREMERRLESCTGWSYYPFTFEASFTDGVEKGEVHLFDENGRPTLQDQLNLSPDVFNYSQRLDYLAAMWREYMEVWWPDQPWEAEVRRAMLPSRAQNRAKSTMRPDEQRSTATP